MTLTTAMDELEKSCEATRDLYLYMLSIIAPLTAEARKRIELARGKFNPTEADLNPNTRFADNALAPIFENDRDFNKLLQKKELTWQPYDILINSVLDRVKEKEYFRNYMESETSSLKDDCKLFAKIFESELIDNEQLLAILEDKSIYWASDDLGCAIAACCMTLRELAEGRQWHLPPLYQSELTKRKRPDAEVSSDRDFVTRLLKNSVAGYEGYFSLISDSLKGWSSDRINGIDIALIVLGLAEAETFPDIPVKVTINEYVEISKYFSLPRSGAHVSSSFVNGMLDRLINKMASDGKITKQILK